MIRDDLIEDEGYSNTVYLDTLGNPTVGVGHLVLPEDNLKIGDSITDAQVDKLFAQDVEIAIHSVEKLLGNVYSILTGNQKRALINMSFNLGYNRLSKFKRMITYIKLGDYSSAGFEILDSKAARQLPKRYAKIYKLFTEESV